MGFSSDISQFVRRTGLRADLVLRKVGLDAWTGIMRRSPVDTGRFRANWRIGRNVTDTSTDDAAIAIEPGSPPNSDELGRAQSALSEVRFGDSIHISNSLPYAQPLEDGHSKQAPNGMVSLTLQELRANIAQAVSQLES